MKKISVRVDINKVLPHHAMPMLTDHVCAREIALSLEFALLMVVLEKYGYDLTSVMLFLAKTEFLALHDPTTRRDTLKFTLARNEFTGTKHDMQKKVPKKIVKMVVAAAYTYLAQKWRIDFNEYDVKSISSLREIMLFPVADSDTCNRQEQNAYSVRWHWARNA